MTFGKPGTASLDLTNKSGSEDIKGSVDTKLIKC